MEVAIGGREDGRDSGMEGSRVVGRFAGLVVLSVLGKSCAESSSFEGK